VDHGSQSALRRPLPQEAGLPVELGELVGDEERESEREEVMEVGGVRDALLDAILVELFEADILEEPETFEELKDLEGLLVDKDLAVWEPLAASDNTAFDVTEAFIVPEALIVLEGKALWVPKLGVMELLTAAEDEAFGALELLTAFEDAALCVLVALGVSEALDVPVALGVLADETLRCSEALGLGLSFALGFELGFARTFKSLSGYSFGKAPPRSLKAISPTLKSPQIRFQTQVKMLLCIYILASGNIETICQGI
jgi:hypothetical protein